MTKQEILDEINAIKRSANETFATKNFEKALTDVRRLQKLDRLLSEL